MKRNFRAHFIMAPAANPPHRKKDNLITALRRAAVIIPPPAPISFPGLGINPNRDRPVILQSYPHISPKLSGRHWFPEFLFQRDNKRLV
jgi:hypothetical protein